MSRFPLVLDRGASGVEVGFESAVLVFLACYHGGEGRSPSGRSARCSRRPPRPSGGHPAFNIGVSILAGAAALLTMRAISPLDSTSPRELAAVGLGCAVFFVVDYVVSAVSIALETEAPVVTELRHGSALLALGVFVAIDSLGYLAALVYRSLDSWTGVLLAVPLVTILVATRALSRAASTGGGSRRSSAPPPRRRWSTPGSRSRSCSGATSAPSWRPAAPTCGGTGRRPRRSAPGRPATAPGGWSRRPSTGPAPRSRPTRRLSRPSRRLPRRRSAGSRSPTRWATSPATTR